MRLRIRDTDHVQLHNPRITGAPFQLFKGRANALENLDTIRHHNHAIGRGRRLADIGEHDAHERLQLWSRRSE